jgi:hypothetical protein
MTRRTTRRVGTSLVEVLVTIGILGIGLTSVIALFPMAAITLGQALRDDRTATSAATADGFIRDIHHRNVVEPTTPSEPYFNAMDGKVISFNAAGGLTQLPSTDPGPSYPVFIDPMGVAARSGTSQTFVGDTGQTMIPRVTLSMIQSQPVGNRPGLALRLCSQLDGLTYNDDGIVQPGVDMRELRYNWLWVVQRPVNRDRTTTTLRIVVFDKRVHMYAPPGLEAVFPNISFVPTTTNVTVPSVADVRKGSWIMDGTIGTDAAGTPIRHANFYRVVSVTDNGNGTSTLELHTPITRVDGGATAYIGNVVVMPNIADVYERQMLTAP